MGYSVRCGEYLDLQAVLDFWRHAESVPTHTDDLESLRALLDRDPRSLLLAEVDRILVGTVIVGWDGWRGSIYRLAVAPSERRKGLASRLLDEAEHRLRDGGAKRLQAIVVENDPQGMGFWRASAWEEQVERRRFVLG